MTGSSALYWSESFSVVTSSRDAAMASGDGACARAMPIEHTSMLPTIIRRLIGLKDIDWLLRRITSFSTIEIYGLTPHAVWGPPPPQPDRGRGHRRTRPGPSDPGPAAMRARP